MKSSSVLVICTITTIRLQILMAQGTSGSSVAPHEEGNSSSLPIVKRGLHAGMWCEEGHLLQTFLRDYVRYHKVTKVHFLQQYNETKDTWWRLCTLHGIRAVASIETPLYLVSESRPPVTFLQEKPQSVVLFVAPLFAFEQSRFLQEMMSQRGSHFCLWLLLSDQNFSSLLKKFDLPIHNKVQTAVLEESNLVSLWEQYQGAPDRPSYLSQVGRWAPQGVSQGERTHGIFEMDFEVMKRNLTGLFLRCLTEEWPPFTYLGDQSGDDVDVRGIFRDVWDELQNRLNFEYRCGRDPNRQWGTRMPNGKWSGIVGSLLAGDADVLMGSLDRTYQRSKILDFTYALEESRFRLLLKRPNPMGNPWTGYTKGFSTGSWSAIVALLILGSVSLYTAIRFSPRESVELSFMDVALTVVGFLCGQAPTYDIVTTPCRIAQFVIAAMTQLVFFHYTSALISSLATSASAPEINSLSNIIASSSHTLGLIKGTSTMDEFSSSTNPLYRDTWQKVVSVRPGSVVSSIEDGVEKAVHDRDFVFFIDEHVYNNLYAQDCRVMVIGPRYMSLKSTITFRPGLPYKYLFDEELLKMEESGLIDSFRRRWRKILPQCSAPSTSALSLQQVSTAFLILLLGYLLSLVFLLMAALRRRNEYSAGTGTSSKIVALPVDVTR